MEQCSKREIFDKLQQEIFLLQGLKPLPASTKSGLGLGPIEAAFPNAVFPKSGIHEFLTLAPEHAAASGGFIAGLLQTLMRNNRPCIWISTSRTLFPPSLKTFGVEPDRIIFIDLQKEKDVLWAMEEALKCDGLAAVVAEIREINLTASRRLQLAVEKSGVTGLLLRKDARCLSTTACIARWQIESIESKLEEGMPGIGFPRWRVELLKVRNGNPGSWNIEWSAGGFKPVTDQGSESEPLTEYKRNTG